MRLAIVGSTKLAGDISAQRIIDDVLDKYRPDVVVSGGAPGVDAMAEATAISRHIATDIRRPRHHVWTHPDGGFRERNIEIVDRCDRLVRIVWSKTTTYGSGWTRDRAAARGIPTEEYVVDKC